MIRHTLLFRFQPEAPPAKRDAALHSLVALCDQVPEVSSLACGSDVDPRTRVGGFSHAFTAVFGNEQAREAFLALPGYAAALVELAQISETVQAADDDATAEAVSIFTAA